MKSVHFGMGFVAGFAVLTVGSAAFAQEATQTTQTTTTTTTAPVAAPATAQPAPAQTGMTLPGAVPDPAGSDHALVAGHFGVGYMGLRGLAFGGAAGTQDAPVVGVRYWLDQGMGIDAGLGLRFSGGSAGVPSYNIAIAHFGVPLALAGSKHFSFQVTPEGNLGYGTTDNGGGGPTTKDFHLDLGVRVGAEVQFGFIGIPELGLQAGIGAGLNYDHVSVAGAGGHTLAFGTSVGDNPWNIFTSNIAALYYFD